MDNRTFDIVSEGDEGIRLALQIAWSNAPGGKATHYKIVKYRKETKYYKNEDGEVTHHFCNLVEDDEMGVSTMILFWHEERDATKLPFPLDLQGTISFVEGWLKDTNYGNQPDHDGDNHKGWRIFNEAWGHVGGYHNAILGVQPAWAMYGK